MTEKINLRIERKIAEFCVVGKLENYREILQEIFSKIDKANCSISAREDGGPSIHEFPNTNGKCHIRIPLKDFANNPVEAIWVILHEFGHHKSGSVDRKNYNINVRMERESKAWEFARKELILYPKLVERISEFDIYAEQCLDSYRKTLNGS